MDLPEELAERMECWRKNLELSLEDVIEANIALDLRSTGHLEGDSRRIAQWLLGYYNPTLFMQELSESKMEQFTRRLELRNKYVSTTILNARRTPEVNSNADPSTHSLFQQLMSHKIVDNNLRCSIETHILETMDETAGSSPDIRREALTSRGSPSTPSGGPGGVQVPLRCSTVWGRGDSPISSPSEEFESASRSGNADRTWISDSCAAIPSAPSTLASIDEIDVGVGTAWGRGDPPSFPLFEMSETAHRLSYTDCFVASNGCAEDLQAHEEGANTAWGRGDSPSIPLTVMSDTNSLSNISTPDGCMRFSQTLENEKQTSLPRSKKEQRKSLETAQQAGNTPITLQFDASTQTKGDCHYECNCNRTRDLEEERFRRLSEEVRRLHDELRQLRAQISALPKDGAPSKKSPADAHKCPAQQQPRQGQRAAKTKKPAQDPKPKSTQGRSEKSANSTAQSPKLNLSSQSDNFDRVPHPKADPNPHYWTKVSYRRNRRGSKSTESTKSEASSRYSSRNRSSKASSRTAVDSHNSFTPSPVPKLCWTCKSRTHLRWACPEWQKNPERRRRRDDQPSQLTRNDGAHRAETQRQKSQQSPVQQSPLDWLPPPREFSGSTVTSDPPCACVRSLDVDRVVAALMQAVTTTFSGLRSDHHRL